MRKDEKSELTSTEDKAIKDIIKTQQDCGLKVISDGEYRRHMFWGTFYPSLNGFREIYNPPLDMFRMYVPDIAAFTEAKEKPGETVICEGKISHTGKSTYVPEFNYIKSLVPESQWPGIKMTIAAPTWYHLRYTTGKAYPKDVYSNDEAYFADLAKAYQTEFKLLHEAGCRNIQFDDPNFAYFCSEKMLAGWKEDQTNEYSLDELLSKYIKLYNACLEGRPADLHAGLHMCRGNFVHSRHFSEGGYDRIAVELFRDMNVDTFYLEYDTERAGTFEPLKHLPKNKNAILGVVTSKFPKLEDKQEMVNRVKSAADIVAQGSGQSQKEALERLGVSPQCGFASHATGNLLGHDDMVNKLELVRAIADEIWPGEP